MFRNGRTRVAAATLAAIFMVCVAMLLNIVTSAGAAAPSKLQQVPGVLGGLSVATKLGNAPAAQKLEIGVALAGRNPAGESALQRAMYDTSSPQYHHFLTVKQFQARFGVAPATSTAARNYLTRAGLKVTWASSGGSYFVATGTVAQLDKLFKVTIGRYQFKSKTFLANNVAPTAPVALHIDGISGLDTLRRFSVAPLTTKRISGVVKSLKSDIAKHGVGSVTSAPKVSAAEGAEYSYTAQDLWGIYDMPGAAALTNADGTSTPSKLTASTAALGQNQKMGVFIDGQSSSVVAQLRLFEEAEGLPKVATRTFETEGALDSGYGDNTGAIEWDLDSQSSTGMAPDVKELDFYTTKGFLDADTISEFSQWANDTNAPREMNASFGECEANPTNPVTTPGSTLPAGTGLSDNAEDMSEPILEQATMEGRTLFASAGDTGSGCDEVYAPVIGAGNGVAVQPVPLVSYPCASEYVVCVGGTVITTSSAKQPGSATRATEGSWLYSGGGASYFINAPSWQAGITNLNQDCVSDDTGTNLYTPGSAPLCRGVPDVADLSGNVVGDGYTIFADGQTLSEGGTSLSSPLMMGQWARIQSAAPASVQNKSGLGFADPLIYHQAAGADKCTGSMCTDATYKKDFYDITSGEDNNDAAASGGLVGAPVPVTGTYGTGNGYYMDGYGWDYVSGWGALDVDGFMQSVDGGDTATEPYTGAEADAVHVCTATGTSPVGNATDPVSDMDDAGADLTQATLAASTATVTATFTVPSYATGVGSNATGLDFKTFWNYGGKQYVLDASEDASGAFSYSGTSAPVASSSTGVPVSGTTTALTGVNGTDPSATNHGLITVTVPVSGVGSPASGALLTDIESLSSGTLGTLDSADDLVPLSVDSGAADSVGVSAVVGQTNCTNTLTTARNGTTGTGGTQTTTVTQTVTTPGATTTVSKTTTTPGAATQAATITTKGSTLTVSTPAPVSYFYFRWQNGVSFGTTKSTSYIAKEIGLVALPSKKAIPFKITQISKPHGRIIFKATKGKITKFTFTLKPKYMYFSYAERAYIKKHHLKTVTGLFEVRTTKGVTYRKTYTVKI